MLARSKEVVPKRGKKLRPGVTLVAESFSPHGIAGRARIDDLHSRRPTASGYQKTTAEVYP